MKDIAATSKGIMDKLAALTPIEIKQMMATYHMREDVEVTDALMERIAGLLRHNPEEWLYVYKDHPLRAKAEVGIKDTIAELDEHAVILVHPHERWCLVAFDGIVYPALFKSSVMDTHLYKIIGGKGSRWLLTMLKDLTHILETQSYTDGDTSAPLAQLDLKNDPVARLTGAGFKI